MKLCENQSMALSWTDAKTAAETIESIAKVVAIGVAGLWTYILFIKKRQRFPRAQITHDCVSYPVNSSKSALRVTLNIKNVGEVLMRVEQGRVKLQQLSPLQTQDSELENFVANNDQFEYDWPELGSVQLAYKPSERL